MGDPELRASDVLPLLLAVEAAMKKVEMTDEEKCRLIAEFEGYTHTYFKDGITIRYSARCVDCGFPHEPGHCGELPDYPHDLNATMRAARKLNRLALIVDSTGDAFLQNSKGDVTTGLQSYLTDPARAAFEALAAYLGSKEREK